MTAPWSLKELRDRVTTTQPSNAKSIIEIINSLGRSREIFDYHKCLSRDAFAAFNTENDPSGAEFAKHAFGCGGDEDIFWRAGLASEANLIACISITRNSFDSFGQLLNYLVVTTPCKGHFYIQHVLNALPAGQLKDQLNVAISSDWFGYVHAFMNTVKHRQLITHNASISFIDDNRGGKVLGFEHKGKHYTGRWVREVLKGTVELQNSLTACGRELNRLYLRDTA
ncbi:hypothetical protein D9M71_441470 [compost metagenome]